MKINKFIQGKYLITPDGSEYFSSEKAHCPSYLTKASKKGEIRYHHQILQSVLIHPGYKQVGSATPFFLTALRGVLKLLLQKMQQ